MATSKLHLEQGQQGRDHGFTRPVLALDESGQAAPVYRRLPARRSSSNYQTALALLGTTVAGVGVGSWLWIKRRQSAASNRPRRVWLDVPLHSAMTRTARLLQPTERVPQLPAAPAVATRIRSYKRPPRAVGLLGWLLPQAVSLISLVVLGVYKARGKAWLESGSRAPQPLSYQGSTNQEPHPVGPSDPAAAHAANQTHSAPQDGSWWALLKAVFAGWSADKAPRLGAALAYYAVFSLAPLLVISLAVASFFFGAEAAQSQLHGQMQGFLGDQGAEAVESLLAAAHQPESGTIAMLLGIAALIFGASGVFGELQDSLNTIWQVQPKPGRGPWTIIRTRFLSFGMVLAVAFLLLISLVVSAMLSALTSAAGDYIPGPDSVAWVVNLVVSLATITALFAMIFKFLPDVKIAWRDVWLGAFVTAVLFTIGKYLIGLYLGQASIGSAYGAAGSVVIVLLWTYYSAQIMFLGAEFTEAYARSRGSRIVPSANAMHLESAPCNTTSRTGKRM